MIESFNDSKITVHRFRKNTDLGIFRNEIDKHHSEGSFEKKI